MCYCIKYMQVLGSIIVVVVLLAGVFVITTTKQTEDSTIVESDNQIEQSDITDTKAISMGASLDLSGQQLTKVPLYVFEQTNLESLDLSNNQLTGALQAEVRHLAKLRVLDLSDNNFTGVPAEVGQLTRLETLDLANNKLTGLPHELSNLKNLKTLDLRGNNPSQFDLDVIKDALPNTEILVD